MSAISFPDNPDPSASSSAEISAHDHHATSDSSRVAPVSPAGAIHVRLRIHELMAEKGIRSVAALHRILLSKHVAVSHSQLLRIVDNRAESWKVEFIAAFIEIFQCEISDLFKVEQVQPTQKSDLR
ncbi:MAG: helix-turn-helix transcriptional regulator [Burkholderiales bacterium]|nr:helix-turn-helix transcriptional regulator [Burkholderiales bacterium]